MSKQYELHLSAYSISAEAIIAIESLGFLRDKFTNNRYCDTTAYHATYRGDLRLPNDELWENLKGILTRDSSFVGGLEEENVQDQIQFPALELPNHKPPFANKLSFHRPIPTEYKACDIHLNVSMRESSTTTLEYISSMGFPSFDKPELDGDHRIFSATCASLEGGKQLFRFLSGYLPTLPKLQAIMKLERTIRHIRIPKDAPALPIVSDDDLENWLHQKRSQPHLS